MLCAFAQVERCPWVVMMNRTFLLLLFSNAIASVGTGIAMIAVPWLLVQTEGGIVLFGGLATAVNFGLFIIMPLVGPVIDALPRKALMVLIRLVFVTCLAVIAITAYLAKGFNDNFLLIPYYILGAAFYAVNIPLRSAFVKELFDDSSFARVNAVLEIENQVAAVVTGLAAIMIVDHFGLGSLALLNIICLLLAAGSLMCIQQSKAKRRIQSRPIRGSLTDGLRLLMMRPALLTLIAAACLPYVVVILYTVIHPVALASFVGASGKTYALVELLFAVGAIIGGYMVANITISGRTMEQILERMIWMFALVAILQLIFQSLWGFIVLAGAFGFWNAVIRIMRQTVLMTSFQPDEVGRISAFLQSWIMLLRSCGLAMLSIVLAGGSGQGVLVATMFACAAPALLIVGKYAFARAH
jgi:predicted MFS family arabinose efflux permease